MAKAGREDGTVALAEVLRDPCLHSNHVRKEREEERANSTSTGSGANTTHQDRPDLRHLFPRKENRFHQRLLCVRVDSGLLTLKT